MDKFEGRTEPAVTTRDAAEALARRATDCVERLLGVVREETILLRDNRLRDSFALAEAKSEAGRLYVQTLEQLRSNAVALGRWSPPSLAALRAAQERLTDALSINLAVLATTRSVSEGIIRSLASEAAASQTLTTYGAAGRAQQSGRPASVPLSVAKSL